MTSEQIRHGGSAAARFSWSRRRPATAHRPAPQAAAATDAATEAAPRAVDPRLVAAPLDATAAIERGVVSFSASLTSPVDGAPIPGATVLFQVSLAARTSIKCQAITGGDGVARTESTLPAGLFDRGPVEYRVSFTGAPPLYWPVSVAGDIR